MQKCLGIYIENNLIKYAKVSKSKEGFRVETFGVEFFEDLDETVKKIVEETYSFNVPIAINLANEGYLYHDVFSLLSKNDIQKTVQTEFELFCDEHKYNQKAFETRYALVPNKDDKEKIRAIQVIVNKIELNKQKQYLERHNLLGVLPIGATIASIAKIEKKENVLIVNMEEKTTISTIYDNQLYNVDTIDLGSEEVLGKINRAENSMSKAYEICKSTTIYTTNVIENEQPYLEYIIPTLYKIGQKIQKTIERSHEKISLVYLTGTLSAVNNIDLYFQEFLPEAECKILKPTIIEGSVTQINIKDYIEVNSAISLAVHMLANSMQSLNFKKPTVLAKAKQMVNVDLGDDSINIGKRRNRTGYFSIQKSLTAPITRSEILLIKCAITIILMTIIYIVFSSVLYKQIDEKQLEVKGLISKQQAEINEIQANDNTLKSKNSKYIELTNEIKVMNDKISNIAEMKNSIPNLLNQIMYIIPENVQLISIENASGKTIKIVAQSSDYDQLGYFIAKLKLGEILRNAVSSSGQKSGGIVVVTIEGELP